MRFSLALAAAALAALLLLGPAQGAFPGTNGLIAYNCNSTQLCTVNPDGSNAQAITTGSDASWSPNGAKLAFVDGGSIYVANPDGTNRADFEDNASEPTWSNDGSTIAFVDQNGFIAVKSSGSERELTTSAAVDPAFSPNGQTIVYAAQVAGNFELFTVNASGTPVSHQLTPSSEAYDHVSPTWSPNGSTILFEDPDGLETAPASGGSSTRLVTGDANDPSYSPDGAKIVYATSGGSLAVVSASGGTATTIVTSFSAAQLPDWGSAAASASTPPAPADTANGPVNTSYPTINESSGDTSPVVGHVVSATTGTWTGTFPITYTYQWKRCEPGDPTNGPCFDISGATSSFYTVQPADFNQRLRVAVSATNPDGRHTQNSDVTPVVTAIAARVATTPQISLLRPVVDTALTLSAGVWAGSTPMAFTYSWRRCDPVGDPGTCVPIVGATGSSYTPTVADIGFSLRVWISGSNIAGSDVAITNHTFPVVDKQHFSPSVNVAPAIGGTALPGRQLTANIGTFNGDAPIATTYGWYRCDANGADCHVIAGAKKVVYFPVAADVGFTLRLYVFASNGYGKLAAQSTPTETVAAEPPHVPGRRIVGTDGPNYLAGGGHDDVIIGRGGNDTIVGGAGDDRLFGGAGNDVIVGGAGADRIDGGPGSDTIHADDGERDVIDCGAGDDRAVVDPYDLVTNCEVVVRQPG